jgi:hypothetical protein
VLASCGGEPAGGGGLIDANLPVCLLASCGVGETPAPAAGSGVSGGPGAVAVTGLVNRPTAGVTGASAAGMTGASAAGTAATTVSVTTAGSGENAASPQGGGDTAPELTASEGDSSVTASDVSAGGTLPFTGLRLGLVSALALLLLAAGFAIRPKRRPNQAA